ncbi:hypothetical protein [Leptospira perolatii]|nr:hypothetical protein [Leptospira perolatii]
MELRKIETSHFVRVIALLSFLFVFFANCYSVKHYSAGITRNASTEKEISGSVWILPVVYSDYLVSPEHKNPYIKFSENSGPIVEMKTRPQPLDNAQRTTFEKFIESNWSVNWKKALGSTESKITLLETAEADQKKIQSEAKKYWNSSFGFFPKSMQEEASKRKAKYILLPLAFGTPSTDLYTKVVTTQQNQNGRTTTVSTRTTTTHSVGGMFGIRLELIDANTGNVVRVSETFEAVLQLPAYQSNFEKVNLVLLEGLLSPSRDSE